MNYLTKTENVCCARVKCNYSVVQEFSAMHFIFENCEAQAKPIHLKTFAKLNPYQEMRLI